MKQYFIGVNKRSEKIILGLMDRGATLMFYYHFKTRELNRKFGFYDGEWFLITCVDSESEISEIRHFLINEYRRDKDFKFKIIYHQTIHTEG